MTTTVERIDEQMAKNKQDLGKLLEVVREDPDLNDAAKRREIGEAYERARDLHDKLYAEKQELIARRLDEARRKAFAPPAIFGADKAAIMASYRDAIARTSGSRDVKELLEVLEQAELTGDEVLAKAVLFRGYQLQNETLVGRYLEGRPNERERWDEFMSAGEAANQLEGERKMFGTMAPPRPPEVPRTLAGRERSSAVPADAPRQPQETLQDFAARRRAG